MKKFLLNISAFSAIILALLCIGEVSVRSIPNPYSTKKKAIRDLGKTTETIVLGSSHSYYGIITDSLENALNLACVSQIYEYDYRILGKYINEFPNLKNAIIVVSYFSFFEPPFERGYWESEIYYKIYLDIDKYPDYSYRNFELSHFESYSGKLSKKLMNKPLPATSPAGFGLDFRHSNPVTPEAGRDRAEGHSTMPLGYETYNRNYFEALIKTCIERNVTPILMTVPAHKHYYEAFNPAQHERMQLIIRQYCNKYGIKHYDFLKDKRFDDADFYDQDHLCQNGAKKFTRIIKEILSETK